MRKILLLTVSMLAMLCGWTGAFLLSSSTTGNQYAWLLPALAIGAGVGLSLRFNSGRRTALLLAVTAAASLALVNAFFPANKISLGGVRGLLTGSGRIGEVRQLQVRTASKLPPFDQPMFLQSPAAVEVTVWEQLPSGVEDICFTPQGDLYASLPALGAVYLRSGSPQGAERSSRLFLHGLDNPTGLACMERRLAVAESSRVATYDYIDAERQVITDQLPADGGHLDHRLIEDRGGLLISIGSRCDACEEKDPLRGTIQRAGAAGQGMGLFASGLRNVGGLTRSPADGSVWLTERSRLFPPPGAEDELNHLSENDDFGWPACETANQMQEACRGTRPAALVLKQRANPADLLFSQGLSYPAVYRDSLIVVLQGAPEVRVRPAVVRIPFVDGAPLAPVPFLGGWDGISAQPSSLAAGADGALYISDGINGAIYRVAWQGGD